MKHREIEEVVYYIENKFNMEIALLGLVGPLTLKVPYEDEPITFVSYYIDPLQSIGHDYSEEIELTDFFDAYSTVTIKPLTQLVQDVLNADLEIFQIIANKCYGWDKLLSTLKSLLSLSSLSLKCSSEAKTRVADLIREAEVGKHTGRRRIAEAVIDFDISEQENVLGYLQKAAKAVKYANRRDYIEALRGSSDLILRKLSKYYMQSTTSGNSSNQSLQLSAAWKSESNERNKLIVDLQEKIVDLQQSL